MFHDFLLSPFLWFGKAVFFGVLASNWDNGVRNIFMSNLQLSFQENAFVDPNFELRTLFAELFTTRRLHMLAMCSAKRFVPLSVITSVCKIKKIFNHKYDLIDKKSEFYRNNISQ